MSKKLRKMESFEQVKVNLLGRMIDPKRKENKALLCGDSAISYGALDKKSCRYGNALKKFGVRNRDRVLMLVRDKPEFFYFYLGLMRIGAIPVALNYRLTSADIAFIIKNSESNLFILEDCFKEIFLEAIKLSNSKIDSIIFDPDEESPSRFGDLVMDADETLEVLVPSLEDEAFWMYSSGTTGKPKGVIHSYRTLLATKRYFGEVLKIGPGDRVYSTSKLFFAFSLAHSFFSSLTLGATVILDPDWPDPESVSKNIDLFRPTVVLSVPTLYRNLIRGGFAEHPNFKMVKYYLSAGEKMPENILSKWELLTGCPVLESIGATETCFLFLSNFPNKKQAGTCGVPTPGTKVKVLDEDGVEIVESKHIGTLWVKMESVSLGYWRLEEKTKEVFRNGWYCTNDMFCINDDGMFEHQGRTDDMLKISGQWVSPSEIEEKVLEEPEVLEAAVVGVPNEDGLIRLALFVVAPQISGSEEGFEKKLMDRLSSELSIYKCPRKIFYRESLPQTATGKLQRFELRKMVMENQTF